MLTAPRPSTILAAFVALFLVACSTIPPGRSAVDDVTVDNLTGLSASDVEDHLATTASPKFLGLFRGVVYDYTVFDEATVQRDLARLERYLQARGYLDAKARAGRVRTLSSSHVEVEFVVDQGPPTSNRKVTLKGVDGLPEADKVKVTTAATKALPPGERFDEAAFKRADASVKTALTDSGYAYAKVTSAAKIDVGNHVVDFELSIDPGPLCTFGDITITGLDPDGSGPKTPEIPEKAVRRALNIDQGSPYSTASIDAATAALLDLGVFSAVEVVPNLSDPPKPRHTVDLSVRLEPTRLRELKIGGGFEFDVFKTELHLLTAWENRNFLGGLRDLSVEWRPGLVLYPTRVDYLTKPTNPLLEEHLRAQLRQPGFVEARTNGFVRPEFNVFPLLVAPNPPPSDPVVGYVEGKGTVGVDRIFLKKLYVSLGYTVQVEDPFVYVGALNPALKTIVLSYPQLVTNLDLRDSAVRPHSGIFLGNSVQVAGGPFGGSAEDVRVQPEVRTYVPLGKRVTLATRASLGFLFHFNYADNWETELANSVCGGIPNCQTATAAETAAGLASLQGDIERMYFRGFFSGGPNTNRGFPLFGVSPYGVVPFLNPATAGEQVVLNCIPTAAGYNPSQCFIPVGGATLWELSNELRVQVSGPFSLATFCDMGDVSPNEANIRLTHLHLSVGGGVRYDTPVGPIRFDVGYRVQPLQVLGFSSEANAANANVIGWTGVHGSPVNGTPPTILGAPIALSIGVGEAF